MRELGCWGVGALWPCTFCKRRGVDTGLGQCSGEFLTPVRHFAARGVAVDEPHGRIADVRELVEGMRWYIGHLSAVHLTDFAVDAQLTHALEDKIHFLLVVVVPGHLTAHWVEGDVTHAEVGGFDGESTAHNSLGVTLGRVSTSFDIL